MNHMNQQFYSWMYIQKNPKTLIWKDMCTLMFIAALFTIANIWEQPECPSSENCIKKMWYIYTLKYAVQFSCSVVSDSLWPHGLQHARPPCPSLTPGVHSNSRPLSQWCHPTISSSVIPFSSRLQSFPASGSFQMSQFFTSGDQSINSMKSETLLSL